MIARSQQASRHADRRWGASRALRLTLPASESARVDPCPAAEAAYDSDMIRQAVSAALCVCLLTAGCCKPKPRRPDYDNDPSNEWALEPLPLNAKGESPIAASTPRLGGASGEDVFLSGNILVHYDGRGWTIPPGGERWGWLNVIRGAGPGEIWAGGNGGRVYHMDSAGWHTTRAPALVSSLDPYSDFYEVIVLPKIVYVPGPYGQLLRIEEGTWSAVSLPSAFPESRFRQAWASGPEDIWVIIQRSIKAGQSARPQDNFRLMHFDGKTWGIDPMIPDVALLAVHGSARDDVWLVGREGNKVHSGNVGLHFDGTLWTKHPLPSPAPLPIALWVTSRTEAYACGMEGMIVKWDGSSWRSMKTGTTKALTSLFAPKGSRPLAVGSGVLLRAK